MAQEQNPDPFASLNLNELFGVMDKSLETHTTPDLGVPAALPETTGSEEVSTGLESFQLGLIGGFFESAPKRGIREDSVSFKIYFTNRISIMQLGQSVTEKTRSYAKETTLTALAELSKRKQEEFERESGRALPNSKEQENFQGQATYWGQVNQVLLAASEIKEE